MIRPKRCFKGVAVATVAAVFLAGSFHCRAAEAAPGAFETANLLYEKGRYQEAATAYEEIITAGTRTAPLLFNAGNAHFKAEQIGLAVANWLQAETLDPRNDRIQINLDFARKSISGGAQPVPLWPAQLKVLTLNEWAAILLGTLWVCFCGLAAGAWKPKLRPSLRVPIILAAIALLLSAVLLIITARDRASTINAVVITPEAVVRFGPLKESQSAFVARDGSEFRMTDFKDEWIRVQDATGREGWLTSDQVILLRGGKPVDI